MRNTTSKSKKTTAKKTPEKLGFFAGLKLKRAKNKDKRSFRKQTKVQLHHSFKRSYREDYDRKTELPGLLSHAHATFRIIFRNKKLFIPLILLMAVFNIILVGLMSEESYNTFKTALDETNENLANGQLGNLGKAGLLLIGTVTTGGLSRGMTEVQQVFMIFLAIVTWLTTIYLVRHVLAKHEIKLRDGLYNALTPLISTLCVVGIVFLDLIPIFIVIITYSAAIATEFLATPFYALVYFIFAALLILLSCYLLSSSLMALIAVTAPGLYPMTAMNTASDIIAGRRIRFIIRMLFLIVILAACWIVVMMPIILIDSLVKSNVNIDWLANLPVVSFCLLIMTIFSVVYMATYFYLFYRKLLDMD